MLVNVERSITSNDDDARLIVLRQRSSQHFFTVKQAAQVVACFDQRRHREEAAVVLFRRIVDIWNSNTLYDLLGAGAVQLLGARIGWLNAFNPSWPQGSYDMDLSIREQ
jgi:hypothetical protein